MGNYVSSELVANLAKLVCANPHWRLPLEFGFQMEESLMGIGGWELKELKLIFDLMQAFVERYAANR